MEDFIEEMHAPQVARVSKPAPNFDVEAVVAGGDFTRVKLEDYK